MNAISIIYRYKAIKEMSPEERKKVEWALCGGVRWWGGWLGRGCCWAPPSTAFGQPEVHLLLLLHTHL